jgi:hypothetical protein
LFYPSLQNKDRYHDRYLTTDYWALQIPAGFHSDKDGKLKHTTVPSISGRYDPDDTIWRDYGKNWDKETTTYCEKII